MEINYKIERKVRLRFDDGMLYCFVFVISLIMIILGYDMWKYILYYRDGRIFWSALVVLLVLLMLFYFLDTAIWRFCGVECIEITPLYVCYTQKKRLVKRICYINIKDVISIKINDKAKRAILSAEDDGGRLSIKFRRSLLCFSFYDQIDIGSQFSDSDIDKLLSVYSSIKTSESGSHQQ